MTKRRYRTQPKGLLPALLLLARIKSVGGKIAISSCKKCGELYEEGTNQFCAKCGAKHPSSKMLFAKKLLSTTILAPLPLTLVE